MTSMATDISPIFGMSLLGLVEWITIIPMIISIVVVLVLVLIHRSQHGLQQRLVSAQLSLMMLEYWDGKKHKDFVDLVELIPLSKVKEDDPRIGSYLSIWEEIAVFCNEKTITNTHMREFFKPDLKAIHDNTVVCGYLKKKHTKTTYHNLWELMEKTCSG